MIEALALQFTIRYPDGREQVLSVDAETARIGSGSHCEIRLEAEDAAVEHICVQVRAGVVLAQARCMNPPVLLNGSPLVEGRLLPDSVLRLGRLELRISAVERFHVAGARRGPTPASRRMIYALCGIGIPLGIVLIAAGPKSRAPDWSQRPQKLWVNEQKASCPQNDPAMASALAAKLRTQAETARERAPFSPEDGTQAVDLFANAAACYDTAEANEEASLARAAGNSLKQLMEREFHVHQVRLERALVAKRYDQAKTEIRLLMSFANHRVTDYFNWLSTLDRQLVVKFGADSK